MTMCFDFEFYREQYGFWYEFTKVESYILYHACTRYEVYPSFPVEVITFPSLLDSDLHYPTLNFVFLGSSKTKGLLHSRYVDVHANECMKIGKL